MSIFETLQAYDALAPYVQLYLSKKGYKYSNPDYKFEGGWLWLYENTSCNCHPDYQWEMECTYKEFAEIMQDEVKER